MNYQPFLIAPFQTGLDTDREPWLLPVDAFKEIENGHIHHGYIQKRQGYRFLAEMTHGRPITAATAANPAVFTVGSATGLADGDFVTLQYLAGGTWSTLNGATYTISGLAGATFNLVDSDGVTVDGTGLGVYTASSARLGTFEDLRIMGIFRFVNAANVRQVLVADTERVTLYDSSSNLLQPLDLYDLTSTLRTDNDVFSSSNTDYIWATNWQPSGFVNRVYFTNGKAYQTGTPGTDGIVLYDGQNPRVEQFQPSLSSTGTLLLYGGKLLFSIRQRLIVLHTFEYNGSSTNTFPQRARWSAAQDPSNWDEVVPGGGGFVDAPTGEQIISATQLQDIIIVHFTNSVWTIRPVSDPALPFKWDKINSFRACDAKMATAGFDRYSLGVGVRGITATDGVETRRIDDRIEDFVTNEVNASEFSKMFIERSYGNRRTWFLYASRESDEVDSALIFDDESSAYSKYRINMNVLGHGGVNKDFAAQDFTAANDLDVSASAFEDETALSFFWSDTSEIFLGGDREGKVYVLETTNTDDGIEVPFSLESSSWNPYKEEGVEAQFGYIDFFLESDDETKFNISFYKDNNEVPYATQALDTLPNLNFKSTIADIVINADPTTGFTVTSNTHGLSENEEVYFYGVEGPIFYNDELWTVGAAVANNTFNVDTDITEFGFAITGITQANPAVVTSTAHGFLNGDEIYIGAVGGMVQVNNMVFTVANVTTNTFELSGIDSTAFTAYTTGGYAFLNYLTGGQITERKFYRTKVWKRAYAGGIGYQHSIKIDNIGSNQPFKINALKPWFRKRGRRTLG